MSAVLEHPKRHAVSAQEYLRMGEAGVFAPEARLELIEGEIVEMAPIGSQHAGTVTLLAALLFRQVGDHATVWVQNPVSLGEHSVPQPDLALLKPREDSYVSAHPTTADVLLLIEVADTTLAYDQGTKVPLYARAGIREAWVIDLPRRAVHVYREPLDEGYQRTFAATGDEVVSVAALPNVRLALPSIFSNR